MTVRQPEVLRRRSALAAVAIGTLFGVLLGGTTHGQEPLETFEGRASVLEVQVPVNVVSKDGSPVRDLTAADFRVMENGRQHEIVDFQVIDLDTIQPDEHWVSARIMREDIPVAARRHVLLLFDLSFSAPPAILKAREAARSFVLESLHPSDLVGLATHSIERGPQLVVTFTPDRVQLARAIDHLGAPRFMNSMSDPLKFVLPAYESELDRLNTTDGDNGQGSSEVRSMQESVLGYLRVIGQQMARVETSYARSRVASWSQSMGVLASALASVQGRKHVVYFSEGFDGRLLLGRQPDGRDNEQVRDQQELAAGNHWMVDNDDIFGNTGLQSAFAHMLEKFRRADVVLQTVDISGLTALGVGAEASRSVGKDALFYIANETGGRLFENSNKLQEELIEMVEESAVTYLLTIRPELTGESGKYHQIKVKANVPRGSRLAHRKGYFEPRPFQEMDPIERGLLASDAIAGGQPITDIKMDVLVAAFNAGAETGYVPVIIEVDGESLLEGHEGGQLSVEFFTYVNDSNGEMKDFFTQLVTLNVGGSRGFKGKGLKYYGHLELDPGDYLVRVLVRNAETGRTGVQAVPVSVAEFGARDAVLLPPFFLEETQDWFLVRESRSAPSKSVVYPFTVNGEPYVPTALAAVRKDEAADVCLVGYNLGDGQIRIDSRILDHNGEEVQAGSMELVERTVTGIQGLDKLLATFESRGLEAGRYSLEVAIIAEASGLLERASVPFTVVN